MVVRYNQRLTAAGMNPGGLKRSGGGFKTIVGEVWTPIQTVPYDDGVVWIPSAWPLHMWSENGGSLALTHPVAGGAVGVIDEPFFGLRCRTDNDNFRPTIGTGGGRNCWLDFDGAATNTDRMYIEGTSGALSFVPWEGVYSIMFWVKFDADGSSMILMDCCNGTSANQGFFVQRTSANKIRFFVGRGGATQLDITVATANAVAASGWTAWKIRCNGTSATAVTVTSYINGVETVESLTGSADQNFTAGTNSANNFADLYLGTTSGAAANYANGFNGGLSDLLIVKRSLADNDAIWTAYKTFNPSLKDTGYSLCVTRVEYATGILPEVYVAFLSHIYSFDTTGDVTCYQEHDSFTTPAVLNDRIGRVVDARDNFLPLSTDRPTLNNYLKADASDTTRPVVIENGIYEGGQFGNDLPTVAKLTLNRGWNRRGEGYMIFVAQNTDDTDGSHFFDLNDGATTYIVATGSGYGGSTPDDLIIHDGDGNSIDMGANSVNGNGRMLVELWWNSSSLYIAVNGVASSTNPLTLTSSSSLGYNSIGPAGDFTPYDFVFKGFMHLVCRYAALPPPAIRSLLRAKIANDFSITLP